MFISETYKFQLCESTNSPSPFQIYRNREVAVSTSFDLLRSRLSNIIFTKHDLGISVCLSNLVYPKSGIWFLGVMDMCTRSEKHEHEDVLDFSKVKVKSY